MMHTPWQTDYYTPNVIIDSDRGNVCVIAVDSNTADQVVKCVNVHQGLVDALKELVDVQYLGCDADDIYAKEMALKNAEIALESAVIEVKP